VQEFFHKETIAAGIKASRVNGMICSNGSMNARRQWRSHLYVHPALVGWHDGHQTVAVGAVREVGRMGPTASGAPGAVRGVFGRAPQAARGHHPNSAPAGDRDGSQSGRVSLGVGTLAQAGVFPRPGALSALSVRPFADHRRHHLPARHPSHFVSPQAGG